jgi:transposase
VHLPLSCDKSNLSKILYCKEQQMRLQTILNSCQKFKSFVYGSIKFVDGNGKKHILVTLVPRKNSRGICSGCTRPGGCYDHLPEREFEFVPLWGVPVIFLYRMRRINCIDCGVKVESVPWADGKETMTKTMMQFLASWAKKLSWQETARSFNTSWHKVFLAVKYVVDWGLANRQLDNVESIGVDEIAWKKGHKYLTLVYQIDAHSTRLLWIGKDRTVKTFLRFFRMFGKENSEKLKHICSDMWKAYVKVIKKKAPQALHILDRFHIVAMINKAIDEVRASEYRQMQKDGYEPMLKKTRWCLLKRKENLTDKQEATLNELVKYNLQSVRAYLLKEDFHGFWEYVTPTWASKFLDRWCTRVMRSKIEPMKKVAKTIRNHKPLILNWFKAKKAFSSGIVEGLNNKVKVATKKAYGFREFSCIEVALYHQLGKLPEPPMTHRF